MRSVDQYDGDYFGSKSPLWYAAWLVVVIVVVSVVFGVLGVLGGWFGEAKRQISPANVKSQWQFAYDYSRSLDAIARNVCEARKVEATETDPAIKAQRTNQRLSQEQNYSRVESEYDARLADAFRAKYIKPSDVPTVAPTLSEDLTKMGCTG